jgi:hypothetical protein
MSRQLPGDHPLFASRRNYTAGKLSRHNFPQFPEDPEQEDGGKDSEQENDLNANGDNAPRGRGGSIRSIRRLSYVEWMQVSVFYYPKSGRDISRSEYLSSKSKYTIDSFTLLQSHTRWGASFQSLITDVWALIEMNDLNWYRRNQQIIRADCYSGLIDRFSTDSDVPLKDFGSKSTILLGTMPGSPRCMKVKMQDAMTVMRKRGKPEYFIKWPFFQNLLKPGQTQEHRYDLTARVFKQKLDELMNDLLELHVLVLMLLVAL